MTSNSNLMARFSGLKLALKALQQLGPVQLGLYGLYQVGSRTGHFDRTLTSALKRLDKLEGDKHQGIHPCLAGLPDRLSLLEQIGSGVDQLYKEADEIVKGSVRLFGGQPVPLELSLPGQLKNWMEYEKRADLIHDRDIKVIWEPGRFGWACKLAMAYHLSNDEQYAKSYWLYTERFLLNNPPCLGPHWSSAQEVAIRLVVLAFATQVFIQSKHTTSERLENIAKAIAIHAERIHPTLVYARSQNNNHLITEALGLYTASALLPEHPLSARWHKLGWKWLRYAFRTQISADGTYTQHSTNYHRLMLQSALWAFAVHDHSFPNEPIPLDISTLLKISTHWLWKLVDPDNGRVPNLGHNDGAYILPLTVCPYHDYRPVILAAARTFLHADLIPSGLWDDMTSWLHLRQDEFQKVDELRSWRSLTHPNGLSTQPPHVLINPNNGSWATLRVATFQSRPAHADQLHVDLWWQGLNLAQDPGTYLYNSPPPWENSLTSSLVHNTVVIDGREFMQRAGRFLYLDWAQARIVASQSTSEDGCESITAQHDGYRKIGVVHSRKLILHPDGHWEIRDQLDGTPNHNHTARLHWLLPDWEYEVLGPTIEKGYPAYEIRLKSPRGWVRLKMGMMSLHENKLPRQAMKFQLARAGMSLVGTGPVLPITGWTSPTYGDKIPALACIIETNQTLPIELKSEWIFPSEI